MRKLFAVLVRRLKSDARYRIVFIAGLSLALNALYALGNLALGIYERSYWFITAGAYYAILSVMRYSAVLFERKSKSENADAERFVQRFSGIMLMGLSLVLAGSVYLSVRYDVSSSIHEIIMITIATYTFTKATFAIINAVKVRKVDSPLLETLRNISLSDAAVSIFSMQRSMLVSFHGMTAENIKLMNTLTGAGVCLIVLGLGILMIIRRDENGKIKNSKGKREDS